MWRENKNSYFATIIAISQLDVCAEHLARWPGVDESTFRAEREKLIAEEPKLSVCRDVHDTHKHGKLVRASANMKHGTTASYRLDVETVLKEGKPQLKFGGTLVLASGSGGSSPEDTIESAAAFLKEKIDALS